MVERIVKTIQKHRTVYEDVEVVTWKTADGKEFSIEEQAIEYENNHSSEIRWANLPRATYVPKISEFIETWVKLETEDDVQLVRDFKNVEIHGNIYPGVIVCFDHTPPADYNDAYNVVYTLDHVKGEVAILFETAESLLDN